MLPLGLEAPVMTPNGVIFLFFSMLVRTAVMSGDDNQCCNAEQCKSPELDLWPVLYNACLTPNATSPEPPLKLPELP